MFPIYGYNGELERVGTVCWKVGEMKNLQKEVIRGMHPSNELSLLSFWKLPDVGCINLNSDAMFAKSSRATFGVQARNILGWCLEVPFGPCHASSPA
uniref:Uncharacterized protein n=1 Tax=Nelumbo nucifera TaxID=4432 RepID=A0A822XPY5_NELNU|nr:TPA_asm: hypothetical protein HUJ06_023973 [Nelumbo nucifera]